MIPRLSRTRAGRRALLALGIPAAFLSLGVLATPAVAADATVERRVRAMGTILDLEVHAPSRAVAIGAAEAAVRAVEAAERRLSSWRPDSELSALNRAPAGALVPVSPALLRDLETALACARRTGGAFRPTLGALVEAWGVHEGGRLPAPGEIARARAASSIELLDVRSGGVRRLADDVRLEAGGFGKGVALDDAAKAALAAGASGGLLDFGGQLLAFGDARLGEIAVADPDRRERTGLRLLPGTRSVATSGNGERSIVVEGARMGHLLDPRTGRPAPDWGSVTVGAAAAAEADCLSTALYVLGPDEALRWAERNPGVEIVVVEGAGRGARVRASSGWSSEKSGSHLARGAAKKEDGNEVPR